MAVSRAPRIVTVNQMPGNTYHPMQSVWCPPPNYNPNLNPTVTWCNLPPESSGFFCGWCATFSRNFV